MDIIATDEMEKFSDDGYSVVEIPEVFSLIHNPDESIQVYKKIYDLGVSRKTKGIYFDHSKCKELEIAASAIMDLFVLNIRNQKKLNKKSFGFGGELPSKNYLKEVLYVSGLLKHLNVDNRFTNLIHEYKENLKTLELIRGGNHSTTLLVFKSLKSSVAATQVIEYINTCMRTLSLELSIKERRYFSHLIGEAIDNCVNHSGDFGQWFVLGHYDIQEGNSYGECNLVLFSFGNSIYESLTNTELNPKLKNDLERITRKHIGWFKKDWDKEVLWTLYALQDGVSRLKSERLADKDRGVGTIKLINAFQQFTTEIGPQPLMSIISGNAYILFDNTYTLGEKLIKGQTLKTIAFNPENDLDLPPDSKNVYRLNNYFPGTIITMKVYLDKNYIEKASKERNGD